MKILYIKWRDSRRYTYQMETTEDFSICEIHTIGFVVNENSKQYVLCQDIIEGDIRGVIVIPKENVISTKIIK